MLLYLHEILLDLLDFGLVLCYLLVMLLLLEIFLLLDLLYLYIQILLFLEKLSEQILVLKFMRDKSVELLGRIVFDELDWVKRWLLSSYSLVIRDLRSLLTLKESLSRSGFSLKSLQSFLVLYLRIMERLAISISISSSSRLEVYTFLLSYFGEIGPAFD